MNRRSLQRRFICISLFLMFFITQIGCSVLKAKPAKDAGFLPKPELVTERRDRAPFFGYWVEDAQNYYQRLRQSGKVFIAPIDTSFINKAYSAERKSERLKRQRIEEAEELARYFRERLRLSLIQRKEMLVKVLDEPSPDALSVHLALVSVVPTNPGVNLIGTVAGAFLPGGGLIKIVGEGSIAFEGYVVDARSSKHEILEQFKDREGQKASPFTFKDYQQYAHLRVVLDDWSNQLAELANTPPTHKVEDSLPVSLNPL